MKVKFLKKEFILIALSLILVGCTNNKPTTDSINKENAPIVQEEKDEKKEISNDSSNDSSKVVNSNEKAVKDENNTAPKTTKAIAKVKLYEGIYFDGKRFGENTLKGYCEVEITNVTNTSFDFTVYQVNEDTKERKVIFLKNTAIFIEDGTKAAFYGKSYTLNFTFPNGHLAQPVVTDMNITGFGPLEGKTYVNNTIPGHEFG